MDIQNISPKLKNELEKLLLTRRNEILTQMLSTDSAYKALFDRRTQESMALKNMFVDSDIDILFERYSDAIYAQEIYELDAAYKQGFIDAVEIIFNSRRSNDEC